jgi:hypothetical protein
MPYELFLNHQEIRNWSNPSRQTVKKKAQTVQREPASELAAASRTC